MTRTSNPAAVTPPSVVILGSDTLLAALPATPTQLANACYASGYEGVFPASWGDELVAAGCLKDLETRMGPAILCSCPLVAEQLRGVAPLQRFQLHLVSPPVAAARYLRALCDDAPLRITYVGDCPGAEDVAIDERVAPGEFLRRLHERGISPLAQRPDLGANVPRDRRRFYSLPGGAPTPEWLSADWPKRTLVDLDAGAALADLAHHALSRESTLIDFALQLGCACSGAVGGVAPAEARRAVAALEPPRARQEVLDPDLKIRVQGTVPTVRPSAEVSWDEFLAALPVAIAPDGSGSSAPSSTVEPPVIPVSVQLPTRPTPAPAMSVAARTSGPSGRSSTSIASATSVRTTQPVPRRAPVVEGGSGPRYLEGGSGPRYLTPAPAKLSAGDRWLLVVVVLVASILSSALTSYFTVRALADRTASAGGTVPPSPAAPVKDSTVVSERVDTVRAAPPPAPSIPTAPPLGDQRTLVLRAPATRTPPPVVTPLHRATTGASVRAAGARATTARAVNTRSAPSPAPETPRAESHVGASPAIVVHVAPEGAAAAATTLPIVDSAPAAAPVAAPAPASVPPPAPVPAAVPATTATPPVDVAAELKAIRDEMNARKHRLDSLTKSLDSLRTVKPPR